MAKKIKKIKVRKTALDRIVADLRAALSRETTNVVDVGNLLIESRDHLQHGDWQAWLSETFDLGYRTAVHYVHAAEYVARKSETVSLLANLSATVLYGLAEGHYSGQEEDAILAAARERRVGPDAAQAIRMALALPDAGDGDADADGGEPAAVEDPETTAILDGPPPDVPPPPPNPPPTDFALQNFDEAVGTLRRLMTKPSEQFARTTHGADDLKSVEDFIHAVIGRLVPA